MIFFGKAGKAKCHDEQPMDCEAIACRQGLPGAVPFTGTIDKLTFKLGDIRWSRPVLPQLKTGLPALEINLKPRKAAVVGLSDLRERDAKISQM